MNFLSLICFIIIFFQSRFHPVGSLSGNTMLYGQSADNGGKELALVYAEDFFCPVNDHDLLDMMKRLSYFRMLIFVYMSKNQRDQIQS